jgi:cyclohexadienyl dehydratase
LSLTWLLMGCPAAAAPQEVPGSALDAVLDRGVLRVCSSGDYRPFTYSATGATYEGADIEMAASLGQSLNVRVAFVQTAWKDLVANVKAGKCDIGMGGISVSLERARETAYSLPYLKDGKTAIARCESASGYTDLAAIDQAGVRVIVNPGGTNQRFVAAHIKHASVTTFPDNAAIFDEIAANRADVMITDASEVRQQVKRHPGVLCPVAASTPFLFGEKAYLLPRGDPVWLEYVNQWLHLQLENGNFDVVAKRWLD